MFYLGPLERRDAYAILSLYMSFFTYTDEFHMSRTTEIFDLRAEKQFWDEMKKGLVCCLPTIMCFRCLIVALATNILFFYYLIISVIFLG